MAVSRGYRIEGDLGSESGSIPMHVDQDVVQNNGSETVMQDEEQSKINAFLTYLKNWLINGLRRKDK